MRKRLRIFLGIIGFIAIMFVKPAVLAAQADDVDQKIITISVYETPRLKVTKTLTIKRGQTVNWWIPSMENTEFADDPSWVFSYWYRKDTQEVVTNEIKFYEDCSVYAVWDYEVPKPPTDGDYLPGYEEEEEDDTLLIQQIRTAKPVIKSLKNIKGKKLRFSIKSPIEVEDYEIRYAANKKFKGYKKLYSLYDEKRTTINKLKKGKTYYIKVRGCKICNTKMYYTKWSKVKKIRIKK